MIRILNVEPEGYADEARATLERLGEVVDAPLSRAELLAALPRYDVLIVRLRHRIDREIIACGERLRAIVSATTGLDHIAVEAAAARGIAVLSLRGETEFLRTISATAEHTWALLLALIRHLPPAAASVLDGEWNRDLFRGRELDGKRLGIIGLGRIGRKVARYGEAFGMQVAAFDPTDAEWMNGVERTTTLSELLSQSDALSVHIPLNANTKGLIGAHELSLLPPDAVLINTSRGETIDEAALLAALESNRLAGAALDVIADEREPERRRQSPLLAYARTHDNLIIGGATHESMARTEIFMAQKLIAFLNCPRF